jgi:hypothetical protein
MIKVILITNTIGMIGGALLALNDRRKISRC